MTQVRDLFIDNGGVITDNSLLPPQYERLVGDFFVPRFGGTAEGWADANRVSFRGVRQRSVARLEAWDDATGDVLREHYLYNLDWLRSMCAVNGVEPPASDDACAQLGAEANAWILTQAVAPFPGALDALRELAGGFTLFTASEGLSFQLALILGVFGIEGRFTRLYGPDFVNTPKQAPAYHERIFAHAGIEPAAALVVDDSAEMLRNAQKAGAQTVLASSEDEPKGGFDAVIYGLQDLPALLRHLQS